MTSYTKMIEAAQTRLDDAVRYEERAKEVASYEDKGRYYRLSCYSAQDAATIARAVFLITKVKSKVSDRALALAHKAEDQYAWCKNRDEGLKEKEEEG